jgi:hypothetical protein
VLEGGKDQWLFNFDEHAGKVDELAEFDTILLSARDVCGPCEFVAFGCRGSDDKQDFAGFNLKGEEMWQQNFLNARLADVCVCADGGAVRAGADAGEHRRPIRSWRRAW